MGGAGFGGHARDAGDVEVGDFLAGEEGQVGEGGHSVARDSEGDFAMHFRAAHGGVDLRGLG